MAKTRFTIKQLQDVDSDEYLNDYQLLRALVIDRREDATNVYAPMYQRLNRLINKLDSKLSSGETDL